MEIDKIWRSSRLLVAELVVVFLGVLVALTADSWWRGQQDIDRALGYMRALQADMSQARVE